MVHVTSTLPESDLLGGERRSWVIRSVTLCVIALFVLAGLTGLLGVKADSVSARSPNGLSARVTYPRRARPALAIPFKITITKPGGFDGPIDVATTTSYLAAFDENGLNPDPDSATTDASTTTWTFEPPEGDTLVVWLDTRIEPGVQWRRRGTTTVTSGSEKVRLDYTSWILP